jgi:hypothetical protein
MTQKKVPSKVYFATTSQIARFLLLLITLTLTARVSSAQTTYYGSKWASDGLANTVIGPGQIQGDYRFRSTHTGALAAIHTYWQNGTGYGGGTGGTYRIDLETDDGTSNHFASGKVLATTTELHPNNLFVTEAFSSPATLAAGTLYHVVYTNIDSNPQANYTSLDMMYTAIGTTPAQPTVPDTDWAHLYNSGTVSSPAWHWRHGVSEGDYAPTLELVYADGTIAGNGYMEVWIETSREIVSGSSQARETFTVSGGDKNAVSFSVRMRKDSGLDPLTVTLKDGAGTTLDSGTIASGNFSSGDTWVTHTFSSPRTLVNGNTYNIILSAPGSSSYSLFPIREGASYNFDASTFFLDGHAQLSTNGGSCWSYWPDVSHNPSTEGDLQFFFTLNQQAAPAAPTGLVVIMGN